MNRILDLRSLSASNPSPDRASSSDHRDVREPLWFGLGHDPQTDKPVRIEGEDVFRGIVTTGSVGIGKTTAVVERFLREIIAHPDAPGALVLSIKDNYGDRLSSLDPSGERVKVIRPGGNERMNLLPADWSAAKVADVLSVAFSHKSDEKFWENQARDLVEAFLSGIRYLAGSRVVTLGTLQRMLADFSGCGADDFFDRFRSLVQSTPQQEALDDHHPVDDLFESAPSSLWAARSTGHLAPARIGVDDFFKHQDRAAAVFDRLKLFSNYPDRTRGSVIATANMMFAGLTVEGVEDAIASAEPTVDMKNVLDGKIIVLEMPRQIYGAAADIAAALLKRQLYVQALRRTDRSRPLFLVADEAHLVLDLSNHSESDFNVASIARSLRLGLILATQDLAALLSACGSTDRLRNFLGNLRTHLYFRQDLSPLVESAMEQRGAPPSLIARVPFLRPFEAVLVRDRETSRRIWTEPVFDPIAPRRAADDELKRLDCAADTAAIEAALAGPRTIYVGVSPSILDVAENAWKEHELPVVRFEGMDLGRRVDAGTIIHALLEASGYREDRATRGLIIVDNLERALEYRTGRDCIEELFRPRAWSIDFQTRIDSSKIRIIAAMDSLSDAKDRSLLADFAVLRIADVCRHDLAN